MTLSTPSTILVELALAGAGRAGPCAAEDLERLLAALEGGGFNWQERASCGRPWLVLALSGWPGSRSHLGDQPPALAPWERLADLMLRQGADPFEGALDATGYLLPGHGDLMPSGFHAAWHLQSSTVLATMLLHPHAPTPDVWERCLAPTGEPWLEAAAAQGNLPWMKALLAHGVRPGPRALGVLGKQDRRVTLKMLKRLWNAGARAYAADEDSVGLSTQWLLSFTHDPSAALAWLENAGVDTEPSLSDWRQLAPRGQHYLWGRWTQHWTAERWLVPLRVSADCQMPLAWWLALNALPGLVFSPVGPAAAADSQWWNTLVPSLNVWPEDLRAFVDNWPKENAATLRDARLTVPGWLALGEVMRAAKLPADVVLRVNETLEQALLDLTQLVRTSKCVPPDAIAWWSAFLIMDTKSCVRRRLTVLATALQDLPASAHEDLRSNTCPEVAIGLLTVISDATDYLQRFATNTPLLAALFASPAMKAASDKWPDLLERLSRLRPDLAACVHAARLQGAWGDVAPASAGARF